MRGLRKKCPRCGARPFTSFFNLSERCPTCGLKFEREEGYWVGALITNTVFTFGLFLVVFVGGIALTWPDVPWVAIGVITVAANLVLPIWFYPRSKTLWSGIEMSFRPLESEEVALAAEHIASKPEG